MIEYERKFQVSAAQKKALFAKLKELHDAPVLHQIDEVFLYQQSSFATFKQGDAVVRIRTENGTEKLTYKRAINDRGDSIEHELVIGDADVMSNILQDMGYHQVVKVDKIRREIKTGELTLAFDTVEGLGDFLEIEIVTKSDDSAESRIMARADELGFTVGDIEKSKYDAMLMSRSC